MKDMKLNGIKDTKGVWVILNTKTELVFIEDAPVVDETTKTPHLLIFNDYQKADYFLSKIEVSDTKSDLVILNIDSPDMWSMVQGQCIYSEIVSGRLNTCVEKDHNCAKLIVLFSDYKNLDILRKAILKQDYDHWIVDNKDNDDSKMYIWDWEHVNSDGVLPG